MKIINNKNNVISDENKLEYQSFLEKLLNKCHINLTSDQLQGIMFQDKIGNDNTNNNNNIESHSIDIDTGMALFKSGKKEEAYRYFKNLFESVHQQSSSSNNKLLDLYQAYAVTSYAINKLDEAANAYEAAGHFEKSSMSKVSLFLQAATIHYKNKNYSESSNAYELVLECTSMRSNIENNNIILDQALSEGESQNKLDMITHIAKAGLGATLVAMEKYKESLQYLVEATEFLENTVLTELKLESSENEFIKSFNNSLSRIQHALNSIESMVDAYIGLDMYSEALIAIKKGINIASKLLTWTDHEIKEKKIKPSDEIKIQIKILKKRKATLLLKQGHSLHCDPNIPIYDSVAYNDELEKIALVWEEAAAEFSFVKDHEKSLSTHKFIANMWTNAADIKPYHMDLNANKELADKAYEAWNNAAKEGTYFAEEKINSNFDKHVILKIRKEVMMALYYSAISALYFNNDVARYNFDLCKTSAEKYGKLLEELNSSSPRKSLEVDQYDYTIFNGDLSYHLAYCYFREGKFEYATTEIQKCISYFITGEDRKKQKRAFGLAALTYSGQRLFEDADRFILMIKKLCLPPQEDPEEEVRELVKIIESEKSASNKSNITKFPILPSSTTQYKLEENNISWFTFLRRNMKFNKIFINDSGNLDLVMIISSSVFIITICYILYPKLVQLIPQQQNLINKIHDSNNNDL